VGVLAEHRRCQLEWDRSVHLLRHHGPDEQAFRNIVNMLHGVRDGLIRDANNYEAQEQASQQILSS
jgi:hypothetical protein